MDSAIVGCWRVVDIDRVGERNITLFGGRPGDLVEFFDGGGCCVWDTASGRPHAVWPSSRS